MPLTIATIRAELTGAPSYRIASSGGTTFVVLGMGALHLTCDDPTELRRLADVCANAADVLEAAQRQARPASKCCPHEAHDATRDARTFRINTTFVGYQSDGQGGTLELRNCKVCDVATLAMDKAELDAAEARRAASGYPVAKTMEDFDALADAALASVVRR